MKNEQRHFRLKINGQDQFFKIPRSGDGIVRSVELLIQTEVSATKLAARVVANLVPEASHYEYQNKQGIIQPFIDATVLQADCTKPIFFLPLLTKKQLEQLFVHMLFDWVIANPDDNSAQFGLDSSGNVIAFDKGEAFKLLKARTLDAYLSSWIAPNLAFYDKAPDALRSVYGVFCSELRRGSLNVDQQSPVIQDALTKFTELTLDEVRQCLCHYASLAIPGYEECLYCEVLKRAHKVATDVATFFAIRP